MGDTIEHWRATIGHWSGGRPRNCVTLHHDAQKSTHIGYRQIRFLVLVSLLIIGCVELNPGPDNETSTQTQSTGTIPKFLRRRGISGLHGSLYEIKTAAFLFARALNRTEEFHLASNVDGAGYFDDLVFRYKLRDSNVWKTCFIQLKHKTTGSTIRRSFLTQTSGGFSLLQCFKSFCKIKKHAATNPNLKQCGPFGDYEFVIYTNCRMESNSPLQGGECDPLCILSSGEEYGKYITFFEHTDGDIFEYFKNLLEKQAPFRKLDELLRSRATLDKQIKETIIELQESENNKHMLRNLNTLQSTKITRHAITWIDELEECDFSLFKEFLSKFKIFQSQSNEKSFKGLTEKELQVACKASPSVANFIYTKFEEGFYKWWDGDGNVVWLNQNSGLWEGLQKDITSVIEEMSKPEIQEIEGCGIRFNKQHVEKLSDIIKENTILNIVTTSNTRILQKLKTHQALDNLDCNNSLFIGIKSLMFPRTQINKLWPCKWSDVLVVDCGSDANLTHTVLDILQPSAECVQGFDNSDESTTEHLINILKKNKQKLILIFTQSKRSSFQEILRNIPCFEDNCNISDLDENSQKKILENPVKYEGNSVALSTLVDSDTSDSLKAALDSDVISILLNKEHELNVSRESGDHCKYSIRRAL